LEISGRQIWANCVFFKKLAAVNNRPRGEKSPNLVPLISAVYETPMWAYCWLKWKRLSMAQENTGVACNSQADGGPVDRSRAAKQKIKKCLFFSFLSFFHFFRVLQPV
jgi:hypothetical protein